MCALSVWMFVMCTIYRQWHTHTHARSSTAPPQIDSHNASIRGKNAHSHSSHPTDDDDGRRPIRVPLWTLSAWHSVAEPNAPPQSVTVQPSCVAHPNTLHPPAVVVRSANNSPSRCPCVCACLYTWWIMCECAWTFPVCRRVCMDVPKITRVWMESGDLIAGDDHNYNVNVHT